MDDETENLDVNIEANEDSVVPAPSEKDVEPEEHDSDEDINLDYDDLPIEDLKKGLELEDFNDEH